MFYYWMTTTRAQRQAERLRRRAKLAMIQFYDKEFLEILKKQTPFAHLAVERPLPVGSVKLKLYGRES